VWIISWSLPTISVSITGTTAATSSISWLCATRSSSSSSTLGSSTILLALVLTGVASIERIEELTLLANELLELVFVKVVSWVEAIVTAFTFSTFDHGWATNKNDWDELEWCVYGIQVIFWAMVVDKWQASVINKRLRMMKRDDFSSFNRLFIIIFEAISSPSWWISFLLLEFIAT